MKRFNYRAKDQKTGRMVSGTIQAENERMAGRLLIEQDICRIRLRKNRLVVFWRD